MQSSKDYNIFYLQFLHTLFLSFHCEHNSQLLGMMKIYQKKIKRCHMPSFFHAEAHFELMLLCYYEERIYQFS